MVTTIETKPNTFYVKKDLAADIGVSPTYSDTYAGLGTSVDLKSNADTNIYIARTNIITENDWQYGDGEVSEMYFSSYINSMEQTNVQTAPWVDVYKLKDNVQITEGNLAITSGAVGNPVVFTSYINFDTPWFVEEFDGVNKWFMESPTTPLDLGFALTQTTLEITGRDFVNAMGVHGPVSKSGGNGNWTFDVPFQGKQWLFPLTWIEKSFRVGATIATDIFKPGLLNELILLKKRPNSNMYAPSEHGEFPYPGGVFERTRQQWMNVGARERDVDQRAVGTLSSEQFGESFIAKATQYNTLFYSVHQDPDFRDIKDQTLEGPGDTRFPLSYTYANLENGASFGDGAILRLKSLWENYSGTMTGAPAQDSASPFGRGSTSNSPFSQDIFTTIAGIPCPVPMDITCTGNLAANPPTYGPEIEIVFKINQMPVAARLRNNTGNGPDSATKFLVSRCFSIIQGTNAPSGEESGIGVYQFSESSNPFINFIRTEEASGLVKVYCNGLSHGSSGPLGKTNADYGNYLFYDDVTLVDGTAYDTTVPMGEWLKLRLKYNMFDANEVLAYFEGAAASGGAVTACKVNTSDAFIGTPWTTWPSCLTLWTSNMRTINASGGTDTNHINYGLEADAQTDDDKIVDIEIDRIAFYGWNTTTKNATIVNENASPNSIPIPTPSPIRPMSSGTNKINLSGEDAFYARNNAFASSYLSFGFDSTSGVSGSKLFFNDFFAIDEVGIKGIPYISGGYWHQSNYTSSTIERDWFSNLAVQEAGTNDGIQIGGGTGYVDRFVQKGWIGVSSSFYTGADPWVKTGNPLHQAKILSISDNGKTITVDKPQIFNLPAGTRYVIEIPNWTYNYLNLGTGSCGYLTPLYQEGVPAGETITLNRSVLRDDKGTIAWDGWNPIIDGTSPAALNISPYKYWINMQIANVSSSTGYGTWWQTASGSDATLLATRSYGPVIPVSGGTTYGSTFNEFLYEDGISLNRWKFDIADPEDNIIDLETNYGFGAVDRDSEETGSHVKGYIRRDYTRLGQNYFDCSNYIQIAKPKPNTIFNFLVKPTFMGLSSAKYSLNFDTSEGTNKAEMIFGLHDAPPKINTLSALPLLNPFKPETVSAITSWISFTWDEDNADTWYRLLFVDSKNITDKYHNINLWAPLDESGSTFGFYTSQSDATKTNFNTSGSLTSDIAGFIGYGAKFDGTDDYLVSSGLHVLADNAARWSFLSHCKPSVASGTIFDTYYTASQFKVVVSSSRIVAIHAGSSKTLTSTNSYECDGVQPLAVAVTYDQNAVDNNWRLYVNGKLEDTQDYTTAISISGNMFIGASGNNVTSGSNLFTGFIEEITSYNETTVYIPPNPLNYVFDNSSYNNVVSGTTTNTSVFYTGRLFVMDYHNIRGKNLRDVGQSPMTSWKVTGI